jgi:hypothetical protein
LCLQFSPRPGLQLAEAYGSKPQTTKAEDPVSHGLQHSSDLPLSPLSQHQGQNGTRPILPEDPDPGGPSLTVLQLNTGFEPLKLAPVRDAVQPDFVLPLDFMGGMGQAMKDVSIVREKEQALRIPIQAAHIPKLP